MISFSEDLLFLLKGDHLYGHTYGLYGLNQAIDFGSLFSHIIVKQKNDLNEPETLNEISKLKLNEEKLNSIRSVMFKLKLIKLLLYDN